MASTLSHTPVFVNNNAMYEPNLINHNLKSTVQTNPKFTNTSMYNLDLLKWQSNTPSNSMNRLQPLSSRRKDYIRENIRHLRQLEDKIACKRASEQCGGSVVSTNRTQNNSCNRLSSCRNTPTRLFKSDGNPTIETKFNTSGQQFSSSTTTLAKPRKHNNNSMTRSESNVDLNKIDHYKSLQLNNSSILSTENEKITDHRFSQKVPPIALNSNGKNQSHQYLSSRTNKSNKNLHCTTTLTTPIEKKPEYLHRPDAGDVENEADMPASAKHNKHLTFTRRTLEPEEVESGKNVEFDRRDINSNKSRSQLSHTSRMWPERRLKSGVIPTYLVKMKQKEHERIQKELENQPDPDQPPGHQRMPEEERLNTLDLLNKAHAKLWDEYSHLPVRMDTLRIRRRRAEIESRLKELEEAIATFSKPKVFIKID
ncbi:unnamed protein product [Schistosoma turkestanicum]|nr:unnamed protein product [Schistosoma turkestanicum]